MFKVVRLCRGPKVVLPLAGGTRNGASSSSNVRHASDDAKAKKIGIIGMGHVGDAVLKNLVRNGFTVTAISDVNADKCRGRGYPDSIAVAKTNREVVEATDVIVTGLPKPPNVKAAFEGADGILAGMTAGKVWIDHSTTDFNQSRGFEHEVSAKGGEFLEAPITGGMDALRKGQMVAHCGGKRETFDKVKPVLDASYATSMYMGPVGTGMVPKVVSNMLCCVQVVAMGEVLMLAKKLGIDLNLFWHAVRASAGNSFLWETAGPCIFNGNYHDTFALDLQVKDIQLAYDMAREAKVPTELIGHMQQIYLRALYQLGPDAGCYAPPKLVEESLKDNLRADGFKDWTYDVENVDGALQIRHKGIDLKQRGQ